MTYTKGQRWGVDWRLVGPQVAPDQPSDTSRNLSNCNFTKNKTKIKKKTKLNTNIYRFESKESQKRLTLTRDHLLPRYQNLIINHIKGNIPLPKVGRVYDLYDSECLDVVYLGSHNDHDDLMSPFNYKSQSTNDVGNKLSINNSRGRRRRRQRYIRSTTTTMASVTVFAIFTTLISIVSLSTAFSLTPVIGNKDWALGFDAGSLGSDLKETLGSPSLSVDSKQLVDINRNEFKTNNNNCTDDSGILEPSARKLAKTSTKCSQLQLPINDNNHLALQTLGASKSKISINNNNNNNNIDNKQQVKLIDQLNNNINLTIINDDNNNNTTSSDDEDDDDAYEESQFDQYDHFRRLLPIATTAKPNAALSLSSLSIQNTNQLGNVPDVLSFNNKSIASAESIVATNLAHLPKQRIVVNQIPQASNSPIFQDNKLQHPESTLDRLNELDDAYNSIDIDDANLEAQGSETSSTALMLHPDASSSSQQIDPMMTAASKKKKKKKMKKVKKKKKSWKKKKMKKKKKYEEKKKKGMKKKKSSGMKKKKKYGAEKKSHKKSGKFKKKKWGVKKKKKKGVKKGEKGHKFMKDKGSKKSGYKKVHHKEEYGKKKKWHDIKRKKKWSSNKKKWKKKWKEEKGKKYKGKHEKKYKKAKKHGKKYKKEKKEKFKKEKKEKFKKGHKKKMEKMSKKKASGMKKMKKMMKKKKKSG